MSRKQLQGFQFDSEDVRLCGDFPHPSFDNVVRVFEQNRADVTFGFGVVLSGRALQFLAEGSADVVDRLKGKMQHWSNQRIVHRGQSMEVDGSSFSAIERLTLLRELQNLCTQAGVELSFEIRTQRAAVRSVRAG